MNAAIALPRDDVTNDTAEPEPPPEVVRAEKEESLDEDRLDDIWRAWQHEAERLKDQAWVLRGELAEVGDRYKQLESVVMSLPSMGGVEDRLCQIQRGPRYVRWLSGKRHHLVASGHPLDPPTWHKTRCGRLFGLSGDVVRSDEPRTDTTPCTGGCYPR